MIGMFKRHLNRHLNRQRRHVKADGFSLNWLHGQHRHCGLFHVGLFFVVTLCLVDLACTIGPVTTIGSNGGVKPFI